MNDKIVEKLLETIRDRIFSKSLTNHDSLYIVEALLEELPILAEALRADVRREEAGE